MSTVFKLNRNSVLFGLCLSNVVKAHACHNVNLIIIYLVFAYKFKFLSLAKLNCAA